MRLSQLFSSLALVTAISCAFAMLTLDYHWATRAAGLWIVLHYSYLISNQYESEN